MSKPDEPFGLGHAEGLLKTLADSSLRDDVKLKALQEINDNFEAIVTTSAYQPIADNLLKIFTRSLQTETTPQFIGENNTQQLRKLMLEIVHRMPMNGEFFKPYIKSLLALMFKLLEVENEENSLICLRIVMDFHRQFRPPFSHDVQQFLNFIKRILQNLATHSTNIFEPKPPIKVNEVQELNVDAALQTAYVIIPIQTEQKLSDGSNITYTLLPRGIVSLKVLAEMLISIIMLHQVYKQHVQQDIQEFIPLVMNLLTWFPSQEQMNDPNFNREILMDFLNIQVKTMSFFVVLCRNMQEYVANYSSSLAKALPNILLVCPPDVSSIRKELMIAFRHMLTMDVMRSKFTPYLAQFFDEKLTMGTSFTAFDSLRVHIYQTLADFVHHGRNQLTLENQVSCAYYFSKVIFDSTLPCTTHTMALKLLLNIVDSLARQSENASIKPVIVFLLDLFVKKFREIALEIIPSFHEKCERRRTDSLTQTSALSISTTLTKSFSDLATEPVAGNISQSNIDSQTQSTTVFPESETKDNESTDQKPFTTATSAASEKEEKLSFGIPTTFYSPGLSDTRAWLKMLVHSAKVISSALSGCKYTAQGIDPKYPTTPLSSLEAEYFLKIVKYGLMSIDVYIYAPGNTLNSLVKVPIQGNHIYRLKEEKEVLEHFASIFALMNLQTFKELFTDCIDYIVERISANPVLQIVVTTFLNSNVQISSMFGKILLQYLVKRMHLMGSNADISNLYLKLLKAVYQSVSAFPIENEQMLRPYLHKLVNNCVEMAIASKEPYNYLQLLRLLFRSIGGGSHDVLYQEFLPVLPGLLKNLNSLQSSYHPIQIRELIVELCLTVPVRLSSLVPHIPMLMEPLVLALNGSRSLVLQGLRTLELCIDNLQPEFLHEHMGSVRSNLMHALWNIAQQSTSDDIAATTAWRTIGKLGGLNRKVLAEKQKVINYACDFLRKNMTSNQKSKNHVLKLLSTFVMSAFRINSALNSTTDESILEFFTKNAENFQPNPRNIYKYDSTDRKLIVDALAALFVSATNKETRQDASTAVNSIVRYITFVAAYDEIRAFKDGENADKKNFMDVYVITDAICKSLADEDKESSKAGILAMTLVLDTANNLMIDKNKVFRLNLLNQMYKSIARLCYDIAWYSKLGGCTGIKFVLENYPTSWVLENSDSIFTALLFVIQELSNEIANGTVDFAKSTIEFLLTIVAKNTDEQDVENACRRIVAVVLPHTHSSYTVLRATTYSVLEIIGTILDQQVIQLIEAFVPNFVSWMLSDGVDFLCLSAQCQIGILEAVAYICSKTSFLNIVDPGRDAEQKFFDQIVTLLGLEKLPAPLISVISDKEAEAMLLKIKQSSLRALLAFKSSPKHTESLFFTTFNALTCDSKEIQDVAYSVMTEYGKVVTPSMEMLHNAMKPLLLEFSRFNGLTAPVAQKLFMLTKLFPAFFTEKLCDQLYAHLSKWLEPVMQSVSPKAGSLSQIDIDTCALIIEIFCYVPSATSRYIDYLVPLITKAENALQLGPVNPWRKPLMQFLIRYPVQTVEYLMSEQIFEEDSIRNYMKWVLKQEEAKSCREVLRSSSSFIFNLVKEESQLSTKMGRRKLETAVLHIVRILSKRDHTWLRKMPDIVEFVKSLWLNVDFRNGFMNGETFDIQLFSAPSYAVKCLLSYFQSDISQVDILFSLLYCMSWKLPADLSYFRKFLEKDVAQNSTVEWKRTTFFKFVQYYQDRSVDAKLKAAILQYVIIPCVARSFERGEGDELIGTSVPNLEQDSDDNLVSVLVNRIIREVSGEFGEIHKMHDVLLIGLYQLVALFVEYAAPHIHDGSKKHQGARLRTIMMFGWPCLQQNVAMDPITKYYGHLLIAHIISKYAINRKIVSQVFNSLLKAHQPETRHVVRNALNILTPAVPHRMEDGYLQLAQCIKKTFVEESYSTQQTIHILQLLVRHYRVFYNIRHRIMQYVVPAMQKIAVQSGALEHRRLSVDVCEMILKWEMIRLKGDTDAPDTAISAATSVDTPQSSSSSTAGDSPNKIPVSEINQPFDKVYMDAIVNFLTRLTCQPIDANPAIAPGSMSSALEMFSKRCLQLVRIMLKPDMWGSTVDLKLTWTEKILLTPTVNTEQPVNLTPICICLDVITYVIGCLQPRQVLSLVKSIQEGISTCLNSPNSQIVKSMYGFITKLLAALNSDANNPLSLDELEILNSSMQQILCEALSNYEKTSTATISSLGSALMLLKALFNASSPFIEKILPLFVRTMQKLAREYSSCSIVSNNDPNKPGADMLIVCLDLMKNRMETMNPDARKQFIAGVLMIILDKSPNQKLVLCVAKLLDEWTKTDSHNSAQTGPREKYTLVVALMVCVERKYSNDREIMKCFLEIAYSTLNNEELKEWHGQLRIAMIMGLINTDGNIREKYMDLFNRTVPKTLFDRLNYLLCSMRWDSVPQHYWIKQCIHFLLIMCDIEQPLEIVKHWRFANVTLEYLQSDIKEELMDIAEDGAQGDSKRQFKQNFIGLWQKNLAFLNSCSKIQFGDFSCHLIHLITENTEIAEKIWASLHPNVWMILTDDEKVRLSTVVVPFLSSKYHCKQSEADPSVIRTFVEAFSQCKLSTSIKPQLLRYLGRAHGLWHKCVLMLEEAAGLSQAQNAICAKADSLDEDRQETLDCLADLYLSLNETDMWASTWLMRSVFVETKIGLTLFQCGLYAEAAVHFEKAMTKEENKLSSLYMNLSTFNEFRLWEDQWMKCIVELNDWDLVQEYAASKEVSDPFLLVESAWRIPNWSAAKECIFQIEHGCPLNFLWKLQLYRGYYTLCSGEDGQSWSIEKCVEATSNNQIKEWRKLPKIVSKSHCQLLQAAQQVVELSEASNLSATLSPTQLNRSNNITEMKSIVKTWRNRSPIVSDSLSHWSQVFSWRLLHYQNLINALESDSISLSLMLIITHLLQQSNQNAVLGIHAFAQCLLQFARASRKQGLTSVAIDTLNRLHTIPNLPVVDGYQKLREQVKCCIKAAKMTNDPQYYTEALDLIENTNISYFVKETSGEFYALKGHILSSLGNVDEAAQSFSAGLQFNDSSARSWAYWGNHLESLFLNDPNKPLNIASQAIVCFLQASRLCSQEPKARKYMPRILWLLKYDKTEPYPLHDVLGKFINLLPPLHWISWIPELLSHLKQTCNQQVVDLLGRIGKAFPETLFYAMKFFDQASVDVDPWQKCFRDVLNLVKEIHPFLLATLKKSCNELGDIFLKCIATKLLPFVLDNREDDPQQLFSRCANRLLIVILPPNEALKNIYIKAFSPKTDDFLPNFCLNENLSNLQSRHWAVTSLTSLRHILDESFNVAFANRNENQLATVPTHVKQKLKNLHVALTEATDDREASSIAAEFDKEFDLDNFSTPRLIQPFAAKLIRWIKSFETRVSTLSKKDCLVDVSQHLSSFPSRSVACDMPTEIFSAKQPLHFRLKIFKYLPDVQSVSRGSWNCKRIFIRALNGKKYAFLIVPLSDAGPCSIHKLSRFVQLLHACNSIMSRNKECASRLLKFEVPSFIPISSNAILLSDDGCCLTFLDVLKEVLKDQNMIPDDVIMRYFDKLTVHQSRTGRITDQNLKDILKDILHTVVSKNSLSDYFGRLYPNAESYFTIRRQIGLNIGLINLAGHCFNLTSLKPNVLMFDKDHGSVSTTFVQFSLNESKPDSSEYEICAFRVTPCLAEFLGLSLCGHMIPAMLAAARALSQSNLHHYLRLLIFNDNYDFASVCKQENNESSVGDPVDVAESVVDSCMNRLQGLSQLDNADNMPLLEAVSNYQNHDYLCKMDPAWHPWF